MAAEQAKNTKEALFKRMETFTSSFVSSDGANSKNAGCKVYRSESMSLGRIQFKQFKPFRLPPADRPFEIGYDSNKALWLVYAACLAYQTDEKCRSVVQDIWKFPNYQFFDVAETDTQAMAFSNDDFVVVAFRGTSSKEDWSTNLDSAQCTLNDDPHLANIKVHRGFNTACVSVYPQIKEWVLGIGGKKENEKKPLYICGHSLGGALATLTYAHFTLSDSISVNGVYTIGQPRVGTPEFVKAMQENGPCMLQRIFNANDVVPSVPPSLDGYKHYGNTIYFSELGQLHWHPPNSLTRRDKTRAWVKGKSGVAAHMGYVYLDLVRRYDRLLEQKTACAAVYKAVIRIHRATKLKAADSNGLSDPYVTLKYGDMRLKSPVVEKTLNPVWEYEFVIPEIPSEDFVTLEIRDQDQMSSQFLGQVLVPVDQGENVVELPYDLTSRPGMKDKNITGSIVVSSTFYLLRGTSDLPCAKVTGTVLCGRALKVGDATGTSDPYVRIHCGSFQKRSPFISKTLNPDWKFDFSIPSVMANEVMYVDVWDHDGKLSNDEILGRATVEFQSFEDVEAAEFPLESRDGHKDTGVVGSIFLMLNFKLQPNDGFKYARGKIIVHQARNLMAADSNGLSDPFVKVKVGAHKTAQSFKTKVRPKTLNPEWEESFQVSQIVAGVPILFEIWDHDKISGNDFLGLVELKFSSYRDLSREWYALDRRANHKDSGVKGEILLSFEWWECRGSTSVLDKRDRK